MRGLLRPPAPPEYRGPLAELQPASTLVRVEPADFRAVNFTGRQHVEIASWLSVERRGPDGTVRRLPELFAGPANVFDDKDPEFVFHKFDAKGQVMDSVEPARHWLHLRQGDEPPYFPFVGRLRKAAKVRYVEVSTEFHDGNHAQSIEVFVLKQEGSAGTPGHGDPRWVQVVPRTPCEGHSRMLFAIEPTEATHVLVHDHPDGGVSRVRLYEDAEFGDRQPPARGRPWITRSDRKIDKTVPPKPKGAEGPAEDYGAPNILEGASVVFSTDAHYASASQVVKPSAPENMGDGWENKRKYEPGNVEFFVVEASGPLQPKSVLFDMRWNPLNNPVHVRVIGLPVGTRPADDREGWEATRGVPLTDWVRVKEDGGKKVVIDTHASVPVSHLLVAVAPCGGFGRLRAFNARGRELPPAPNLRVASHSGPASVQALALEAPPAREVTEVRVEPLTEEAFRPFGQVFDASRASSRTVNAGTARRYDMNFAFENGRANAEKRWALYDCDPAALPIELGMLERHPESSQAFMPMGSGEYLVCVCPTKDDAPDLTGLRAFVAREGQGVNYTKGTWHYPIRALGTPRQFMMLAHEDGTPRDCEEHELPSPIRIVADGGPFG